MPRRRLGTGLLESIAFLIVMPIIMLLRPRIKQEKAEAALREFKFRKFTDVTPEEFELAIGELFTKRGFRVLHSGKTGDGGVDLELRKDGLFYIAQCKRYSSQPIGEPIVRDFYGTLTHKRADHGYLVTTSRFTKPAINFASNKPITLIDKAMLQEWLNKVETPQQDISKPNATTNIKMKPWQIGVLIALILLLCALLVILAGLLFSTPSNKSVKTPTVQSTLPTKTPIQRPSITYIPISPNQSQWNQVVIELYQTSIRMPPSWKIEEINRKPEPEGFAINGHDCAEYVVSNEDKTIELYIRPVCGFGDGGATPLNSNAVFIEQQGDRYLVRYFDEINLSYLYGYAGYVNISDANGARQELYISTPPIIPFGDSQAEAALFLFDETQNADEYLVIVDKIIASIDSNQ